jgi:hypothetical protein
MKNSHYAIIAVLIILVGGGSFYGGMQFQKTQNGGRSANTMRVMGGAGGTFQAGGRAVQIGGFTNGEILSTDEQGLTLKLMDGGSKVVFLSASTTISTTANGTKDDLKPGTNVMITGTSNQDGSLTASMVQIRPAGAPEMRTMRFDGAARP